MEDQSLTMMLFFFGSFLGAFTGAICSTVLLWIVYYFWLKKSEEDRLWNLAKKAGLEAMGYASSFMKTVLPDSSEPVLEESKRKQDSKYQGFYDNDEEEKSFIEES